MKARIFSAWRQVGLVTACSASVALSIFGANAIAQNPNSGYYTDPATGIVYRQVSRTIEKPVVETKMERQNQTVYRPQRVTETKPEQRTVYTPVVEYHWEPRMHGRWNPFVRPTVAYHHVPRTRWEAQNQVVQRTNTRTQWVAENRTVEVPQQVVRMQREQKVDFEPVGTVAVPAATSNAPGINHAIASRLRPLDPSTRINPMGTRVANAPGSPATSPPATTLPSTTFSAPQIAASSVGRMTSDPPRRSFGQGGLRATQLAPSGSGNRLAPPSVGTTGIANSRPLPFLR